MQEVQFGKKQYCFKYKFKPTGRKSKGLLKEKQEAEKRLREIAELEERSLKEEAKKIEDVKNEISDICKSNDLFCGVILTQQDILEIVKIAMESKENVSIPFQVYYND